LKGDIVPFFIKYNLVLNKFFENLVDDYLKINNNLFLVDYFIDSANKINIIIDGDSGVTISDCVKLSKHLKKNLMRIMKTFHLKLVRQDYYRQSFLLDSF